MEEGYSDFQIFLSLVVCSIAAALAAIFFSAWWWISVLILVLGYPTPSLIIFGIKV